MTRQEAPQSPDSVLRYLERRTVALVALVEAATQANADKKVRDTGAQLVERIAEMLEDLFELAKADDEDFAEAADVYHRRLFLAEKKVDTWNIPESVKKRLSKRTKAAEPAPRGRRAPRRKAA